MFQTDKTQRSERVPLNRVRIRDDFWSYYIGLVRDVVVPYQWEALNDRVESAEPSGAVRNFRIAAGLEQGDFYGMVFQDSDLAKWLEAVSYLLEADANPQLEETADGLIDIIAQAQQDDGYLNTYFTVKEPDGRWTNLTECHELYCAGHMIEAGWRITGLRAKESCSTSSASLRIISAPCSETSRGSCRATTGTRKSSWRWSNCTK